MDSLIDLSVRAFLFAIVLVVRAGYWLMTKLRVITRQNEANRST